MAGDRLGEDVGLHSSRFRVFGPISLSEGGLTVPMIARQMGLARQSVHATVDRLVKDGLVERVANSHHRRSFLVRLTDEGKRRAAIVQQRHAAWANRLAEGLSVDELGRAVHVLEEVARRLALDENGTGED